jgi:peptide/nickel transport system substrate-binding protein
VSFGRPAWIAAACALACVGGACKKAPPAVPIPTRAWLDGELPPEVYEGTPVRGGTLTVRLPVEPAMLNRLHDAGQDAWLVRTLFGSVYETLLQIDRSRAPDYPLAPALAESWEVTADGLSTIFRLRRDVRFHDGSAFSSADVRAVIHAVMDPGHPTTAMRGHLAELAGCETPDAHTVVLRWKRPYPLATRSFALAFPMVPAKSLEGDFDALAINRAPIGTGPFKFEQWEGGREISLVRNDDYYGPKAYLDRVVFRIVRDATVAMELFKRGEFDLMTSISPNVWRELEKPSAENAWAIRGYHRIRFIENAFNWIGWNQERTLFADRRVRRALTHLVPMDAVYRSLTLGLEPPTTCPFYSKGSSCDPALEAPDSPLRLAHDPARAGALLREAGWTDSDGDGVLDKSGVPFRFSLLVSHSVFTGKLAALLQQELRKAGIVMEIERAEWAVFLQRLRKHDFDAVVLGSATADVENDLFPNFHSSQRHGGSNYVSYANPEVDALLDRARRALDREERIGLHRRIHRALYEDQVYTFLGTRSSLDAVKVHVKGIRPAIGWYRLAEVWLSPSG